MLDAAESAEDRVARIVDEVTSRGDFPAAARVIQRLHEVVRNEHCQALDVARVILGDPGLSSKVLRVVNSSFYYRRGGPCSTITRAVILLGFEPLRDLATGLLLIDEVARSAGNRHPIRVALQHSLLCGLIARALAAKVGYSNAEEAYLLGIFATWGSLTLAVYYPTEFDRAEHLVRVCHIPIDEAIVEVFGVRPSAIAIGILARWNLPPRFTEYFRRPRSAAPLAPGDQDGKLLGVVGLAAEYATHMLDGNQGAAKTLVERYEHVFGRRGEELLAATHEGIEVLRDQAPLLHLGALAVAERERATGEGTRAQSHDRGPHAGSGPDVDSPAPAARQHAASNATADGHRRPLDVDAGGQDHPLDALAILAEITRAILENDDINDTLAMVLEGVARTGGFDVVFLALSNVQKDRLLGRLGYGEGVREFLSGLDVRLTPDAGVLAETVLAREARVVASGSAALFVPRGAPVKGPRVTSFICHPLVVRGKAIGVLVAARSGDRPVADSDLSLVQIFCNQAVLALDRAAS